MSLDSESNVPKPPGRDHSSSARPLDSSLNDFDAFMTEPKEADPLKKRARQRGEKEPEKGLDQKKGEEEKNKGKKKGVFREYTEAILLALLLALFLRAFVVQAFKIPSGSMKETLQIGDHILVNKLLYRTWTKEDLAEMFEVVPILGEAIRSLTQILPFDYHFRFKDAKRGDILVFKFPRDETRDFIKRVIGLPGDTIEVREKTVFVNGKPLVEPYAKYNERGDQGAFAARDKFGPVRVPEGHLFMMGDNRDNSLDSRAWGFLNMNKVRGEAFIIYWSCKEPGLACLLPFNVRWGRFGKILL